jgi:hypothetical protein
VSLVAILFPLTFVWVNDRSLTDVFLVFGRKQARRVDWEEGKKKRGERADISKKGKSTRLDVCR